MRYSQIITEVPQIIPPTDFNMSDDRERFNMMRSLTGTFPQEVLEDTPTYKLVKAGAGPVVTFFMLQKPDDLLVYFARCKKTSAFLGGVVTQVSLWRDEDASAVRGITAKVFALLIETYGTVLSDEQQTENGKTFWRRRLAEAAADGLRVGLADMKGRTVDWYDPDENYQSWIAAHMHAWSPAEAAQNLRFIISNQIALSS